MTVELTKGSRVNLRKQDGSVLTAVRMGLGWDPAVQGRDIDLDANCTGVAIDGTVLFTVSFKQLRTPQNSARHGGDNLTGRGEGDDESIYVKLALLIAEFPNIAALYFTVCSFSGQKFKEIANASCHIVEFNNDRDGEDLGTFKLSGEGNHTAALMSRLVRNVDDTWTAEMIGELTKGRVASRLEKPIKKHLAQHPVIG